MRQLSTVSARVRQQWSQGCRQAVGGHGVSHGRRGGQGWRDMVGPSAHNVSAGGLLGGPRRRRADQSADTAGHPGQSGRAVAQRRSCCRPPEARQDVQSSVTEVTKKLGAAGGWPPPGQSGRGDSGGISAAPVQMSRERPRRVSLTETASSEGLRRPGDTAGYHPVSGITLMRPRPDCWAIWRNNGSRRRRGLTPHEWGAAGGSPGGHDSYSLANATLATMTAALAMSTVQASRASSAKNATTWWLIATPVAHQFAKCSQLLPLRL